MTRRRAAAWTDTDDATALDSRDWQEYTLETLPGVKEITYGIVHDVGHHDNGVPMLRAGDIVDGSIRTPEARISANVHLANPRTRLTAGAVVIVLVGRIGEAAVVGPEQADWNAARSVGVVTFTDEGRHYSIDAWLLGWLTTQTARTWCADAAEGGSAHATLSIAALSRLPVPLPPLDRRRHALHTQRLIAQRKSLNNRIGVCAVELADHHFAATTPGIRQNALQPLGDIATVIRGVSQPRTPLTNEPVPWAAPSDIFPCAVPMLDRTERTIAAGRVAAYAPGLVLLAPRPAEVSAVVSRIPVVPGRGSTGLLLPQPSDAWWLLHALRSMRHDLTQATQGGQGREMAVRALARTPIPWPGPGVRQRFADIARPLHERAYAARTENPALEFLLATEMGASAAAHHITSA